MLDPCYSQDMVIYFTLDGTEPVPSDKEGWREFFRKSEDDRTVGDTTVGDMQIRTEFLGINQTRTYSKPNTFRTTINHLTGTGSQVVAMAVTWEEAQINHQEWVEEAAEYGKYAAFEADLYR